MTPAELTYDLLDDLILAEERGRGARVKVSLGPSLGPTVELLLFSQGHGDVIDVAASPELNAARTCLSNGVPAYLPAP